LIAELGSLRTGDRRAILDALPASERAQVAEWIEAEERLRSEREFQPRPAFSAWLHARLAEPEPGGSSSWQVTAATRSVLAAAAQEVAGSAPAIVQTRPGRSLTGAVLDLFSGRRSRP
jgi:hypothetical protein